MRMHNTTTQFEAHTEDACQAVYKVAIHLDLSVLNGMQSCILSAIALPDAVA